MENNRDHRHQNKSSRVVDATIYSLITNDSAKGIQSLAESQLSDSESLSTQDIPCQKCSLKRKCLSKISTLAKTIKTTNEICRNKYMKCSTYIKSGAFCIVQTENNSIKRAIKYNETSIIDSQTKHVTPDMVKLQSDISQTGKHPCIDPITAANSITTVNDRTPLAIRSPFFTPYTSATQPIVKNPTIPTFILQPPLVNNQFSPIEAVNIMINLPDKKLKVFLDRPKTVTNQHPVAELNTATLVKVMIHKNIYLLGVPQYIGCINNSKIITN